MATPPLPLPSSRRVRTELAIAIMYAVRAEPVASDVCVELKLKLNIKKIKMRVSRR